MDIEKAFPNIKAYDIGKCLFESNQCLSQYFSIVQQLMNVLVLTWNYGNI
jgi:hypothetical protein